MTGKAIGVAGTLIVSEPQRMFPPCVEAKDGTEFGLFGINRSHAGWTARGALFIREMDGKAVRIAVLNTRFGKGFVRPCIEPRHVPAKHIVLRFALNDPLSCHQSHATGL